MSKVTRVVAKKPSTVSPLAQLRCSACDTTFVGLGEPPANALRLNKVFLNSLEVECPPKAHLLSSLRFCPPCTLQLNDLDLIMSELANLKKRIENGKDLIRTKFTNVALAKEFGTPQCRNKGSNALLVTLGDLVLRKWLAKDSSVKEIVIGDGNKEVSNGPTKKTLDIPLESTKAKTKPSGRNVPEKIKKANVVKTGNNSGNCGSIEGASVGEGQRGQQRSKSKDMSQKSQESPSSQVVVNVRCCDKYVGTMFFDESESGSHEHLLGGMSRGKGKNYEKIGDSWTYCAGQPVGYYQTTPSTSHLSKDAIPGNPLAGRVSSSAVPAVSLTPIGAALKTIPLSPETRFTITMCTLCFQTLEEPGKQHLCGDQN